MDKLEYYGKPIIESINQHSQKRETWLKSILLLSSSLFGILISLQNTNTASLHSRICFAVAIALLGCGILLLAIALYGFVDILAKHRADVLQESLNAFHENRALKTVSTKERSIFSDCEKIGYICLAFCVVSLVVYTLLLVLHNP